MTKKAIITTHDGREASVITKASNVLFEDGQTAQDILNDRQDTMITPIITTSTSMSKVGQGDSVDYSENVVDGAYESCVLKGNTKVNLIQESSSQDVVLPYEFTEGQSVTINDTKESGALGVELKGQTLVNSILSIDKTLPYTWVSNNIASRTCALRGAFKTGVYALIVEFGEVLLGGVQSSQGVLSAIQVNYTDGTSNSYTRSGLENYSKKRFFTTFTINKEVATMEFKGTAAQYENVTTEGYVPPTVTINKIMILEYQEGMENWDIPYFEGMASCKMPTLKSVGKNLFDTTTQKLGSYWSSENTYNTRDGSYISDTYVKVTTGQKLRANNTSGSVQYMEFDSNKNFIQRVNVSPDNTYTVPNNVSYLRFSFYDCGEGFQCQIEEGDVSTTYEPHKSSILSLPEEVVLRSLPNGVCDTFNTRTGVYTQRIGEAIVNGSENWQLNNTEGTTTQRFFCSMLANSAVDNNTKGTQQYLCDRLRTITWSQTCELGLTINGSGVFVYNNSIEYTVDSVKQWLSQNPVKLQYELATPIVTKINLSSTLKSWNTTTHIYSEIPENTLYPTLSHSNPSYPVILKPSTKYSIVANSYSNDHTNSAINFNLGGATASTVVGNRVTTITTPSALSNELLTMSGRGNKLNNVMVIEGDVVGDEPYFEGICDCKSPILSNVGKNLIPSSEEIVFPSGTNMGIQQPLFSVKLKPNTTYILSGYFTQNVGANGYCLFLNSENIIFSSHNDAYANTPPENRLQMNVKFTTNAINVYATITANSGVLTGEAIYSHCQLEESPTKTTYEPYKTNILSVNGDRIELTQDMFEQGSINDSPIGTKFETMKPTGVSNRIRSKELIRVKPNTTYILNLKDGFDGWCVGYDKNGGYNGKAYGFSSSPKIFTTMADTQYICPVLKRIDNTNISPRDIDNFELREIDKTIVLRSLPSGVCDTLNVETGEYIKRIGEKTFSGANNEGWTIANNGIKANTIAFGYSGLNGATRNTNVLCDTFIYPVNYPEDREGIQTQSGIQGQIYISIFTSKLSTPDDAGFKAWLQANPVTVQYELATPIISTIDIQGFPFAYENGHVQLSSGSIEQSLTPKVEYSVATNRNGQIRSNQKMVEKHQKELDKLQAVILANLVNSQYNQTLTTLKYELSRV